MKTKEELNTLKDEAETLKGKLAELSEDELGEVTGGLGSAVEILKTLNGKAINAVNDTNTEVDRGAIQKEIDASVQQIDDNALLTFNGKFLNNGSQSKKGN